VIQDKWTGGTSWTRDNPQQRGSQWKEESVKTGDRKDNATLYPTPGYFPRHRIRIYHT